MKKAFRLILVSLLAWVGCTDTPAHEIPLIDRLQPVPKEAGFRMPGYFVWGGSLIYADGQYHLFASRWPHEDQRIPSGDGSVEDRVASLSGYRQASEIVRAISADPLGPYRFVEVVVSGRGGDFWDGQMCHNPKIVKIGDRYVLYYIGRSVNNQRRKVGYAWAESVAGPWQRSDESILLTEDANNPAPYIHADGRVVLAFRDRYLVDYVALADRFDGRYEIWAGNIVPGIKLEDPTLFVKDGLYHMVIEDNRGQLTGDVRHGAHLVSEDARNWRVFQPVKVYTHTIQWTDGTATTFDRRERPELVNLNQPPERKYDGEPTHLITGVQLGQTSWCVVQPIAPIE